MRVLMTGGGTAGHVNPALAIAAIIREAYPAAEIAFVASALPRDKARDLVPRAGYPLHTVHIEGLRRPLWSPGNLRVPFLMARSRREAARIIEEFRPDLIVGTGGFACWPLCREGVGKGIPTVLHESNAIPGKAVCRLAGRADAVMLNFEATAARLPAGRTVRVGNPMMPGFATADRAAARRELGLSEEELYVLAFGGSLGAEYVNDAVVTLAGALGDRPEVTLLHGTGKRDHDRMLAAYAAAGLEPGERLRILDYIYDMPVHMAAADLVISRAGAMSLSELALLGKAAILVPSPYVAEQHQLKNAMALVDKGAAACVEEHTLPEGTLTREALRLLDDPAARAAMGESIRAFACPDAGERILGTIRSVLEKQ